VSQARDIVLFDGVCVFCNGTVRFIARRDPQRRYRFAQLGGPAARKLLGRLDQPESGAIVLVEGEQVFMRSTAALRIARRLSWPYPLLYPLLVVPRPIRDAVYDWIARNRYRWWGKLETCPLPTPEDRGRFLD
jgi:predicted DCC family thiol-disulfide oxidoreductase YuxK